MKDAVSTESRTRIVNGVLRAIWSGASGYDLSSQFGAGFRFRNFHSIDDVTDLDGLRRRIASVRSTNPEGRWRLTDALETGDLVVVWWAFGGDGRGQARRSRGAARATPADVLDGVCMSRLEAGRISEMWELGGQLENNPLQ